MAIQCHLRRSLAQGVNKGFRIMNRRGIFVKDCLSEQARNCNPILHENVCLVTKEEGAGVGRPLRKPRLCAGTKNYSGHRGKIVVGVNQLDRSLQILHLSAARKLKFPTSAVKKEELKATDQLLKATEHHKFKMAPRQRATSRRGRNYGQRGQFGGRGAQSPRHVSPLAFAWPRSPELEDSGQDISNTVQTVKFKYHRRTNTLVVSALITAVFSEEDEEEDSGKEVSEEKEPRSNNSSQSRGKDDSSYLPSSQSRLEEESTGVHSEEQNKVLREIGSIMDMEVTKMAQQSQEKPQAMEAPRKGKEPDRVFGNILYLKLPPGIHRPEDIPDGMEMTWEPDPEREAAEWEAEQRAAEDQAEGYKHSTDTPGKAGKD